MNSEACARDTLRRHSKSFDWAGRFLSPSELDRGARLYRICREVDDWADNASTTEESHRALLRLTALHDCLATRSTLLPATLVSDDRQRLADLLAEIHALFANDAAATGAMKDLLKTMIQDLSLTRLEDDAALLNYAYGAAGTVGIMMCHCLQAREIEVARPFAMDMGIAMQMTNIARDVLEDAQRERIYLPACWMNEEISPQQIAEGDSRARHQAWQAARMLVARAEEYYASGWQGLVYLPARPRLSIAIACRVYRDIGRRILRLDEATYWSRRTVVSRRGKICQSLIALVQNAWREDVPVHNSRLHAQLTISPAGSVAQGKVAKNTAAKSMGL